MKIIKLGKEHIKEALFLVWEVFDEFESVDFSEEGIEEFKKFIDYNNIINKLDSKEMCMWGCFESESLTGVMAVLNSNHISLLFVKKQYHRKGIAKELINVIKEICNSQNIKTITVNSSEYAVEIYRRLGFENTDNEKVLCGIRFIPMIYYIK